MDISENTALIEALLIEDIPECDINSDLELSDDENYIHQPLRSFDEIIDETIHQSLYTLEAENEADDVPPTDANSSTMTSLGAKNTLDKSSQLKKREEEKNGTKSTVICPRSVKDYNTYMGGVDTADRLRALYCVDRKSPKWWHRLFWGVLDIAFVNAYVVHGLIIEKSTVKDFRRSVAQGLMTMKDLRKKKRTSKENVSSPCSNKRRKMDFSTLKDVRLGNRGIHWPVFVERRGRCEVCSMKKVQSKPHSKCSHCDVFLCLNEKKNCFTEYHEANN